MHVFIELPLADLPRFHFRGDEYESICRVKQLTVLFTQGRLSRESIDQTMNSQCSGALGYSGRYSFFQPRQT